jgi:UDPglucose 6-dehydrogenase
MKIGFIGLGKLGLPIALAIDAAGHAVTGYDVSDKPVEQLLARKLLHYEKGADELLQNHSIQMAIKLENVVLDKDIVFVCVQTPHAPEPDGSTPVPNERRDFEYGFLAQVLKDIGRAPRGDNRVPIVAVISTVLPGTLERLQHLIPDYQLVYNPSFCAMGTVIPDYQNPEFVLLGTEDTARARDLWLGGKLAAFHGHQTNVILMSIPSAELTKVAYNTFIGMKIVFANTMMEICHHTGADVDDVTNALGQATDRLMSPRYMSGGMGDGGPCHPRDNIAMSWLAEHLNLSSDLFGGIMRIRDHQTEFLARLVQHYHEITGKEVVILGRAYKPESALTDGSPATLLAHHLNELGVDLWGHWDPFAKDTSFLHDKRPAIFVIATKHAQFAEQEFPAGSVVLDPFGYIPDREGVTVVRIGRKS